MIVDFQTYRACRRITPWTPTPWDEVHALHAQKLKAMFAEMAVYVNVTKTMAGEKPGDTE